MKLSLVTVALVAITSSLVTVGVMELLRQSRSGSGQALASNPPLGSSASPASTRLNPLVPSTGGPDRASDHESRLVDLERRMAALELGSAARRAPMTAAESESRPEKDLRDLVLGWVAEERQEHSRASELEEEEQEHQVREFKARRQALLLAQEHDLVDWQEKKLFELFFEIELRDYEIGKDTNPLKAGPEEFERRWAEFDVWADRRYIEVLGQELFDQLFGDD